MEAVARLAPPHVTVERFAGLARLPHFDPDVEERALPPEVAEWRGTIARADALLIASPEYAHGVPGSLKNALDWLVGGPEFVGKPVAVVNPAARARFAQPQLVETLRTMAGVVVEAACVTLPTLPAAGDDTTLVQDPIVGRMLREAIEALRDAVSPRASEP